MRKGFVNKIAEVIILETILIVDDDKDLQFNLAHILQDEGYKTIGVERGRKVIAEISRISPAIVLLDINLPDISGMEVLEKVQKMTPAFDGLVIILTAYGDMKGAIKAMKLGAYDYVTKPFDNEGLVLTIEKALNTRRLSREVINLRKIIADEKVMGESPQITEVLNRVDIIAATNMSVIIQGASGTGKEVFAKLIHQRSLRADKPFIPIDCGAIPDALFESELFGYEKGAFTGAVGTRKGKFVLADKGTLLLDEITNLPKSAQAKFLRALEERTVHPLGGNKSIPFDVRIIANTNVDIGQAVYEGKFREDLYQRLNEFKLILPLLGERIDDIPVLANSFLENANVELHKTIAGFTTAAMKKLLAYSWPGNVRELRNVIKRAVLWEENDMIAAETIEFDKAHNQKKSQTDTIEEYTEKIFDKEYSLKEVIAVFNNDIERKIIEKVLKEVNYNKSKAAEILDMERKTLYAKMKLLGIGK